VLPKRVGLLEISPLTELVLGGARLEVFEETPRPVGAAAPGDGARAAGRHGHASSWLPALAGGRRVAGATLLGLEGLIVRDGAPLVRVEAAHATAELRTGDLALRDLRVVHLPTSRTLVAARGVWRVRASELAVRGEYALEERGIATTGRALRLDADFRRLGTP
jgi:hypothetical protein